MLNFNTKRMIIFIIQLVGVAVILLALTLTEYPPICYTIFFIGLGVFVIPFLLSFIILRCPSCRRWLYAEGIFFLNYCPHCGEELYENNFPRSKKK